MQEKYSQGTERLQHYVMRLSLRRSLKAAEYDTLKLQWINTQTKLVNQEKCENVAAIELLRPQHVER